MREYAVVVWLQGLLSEAVVELNWKASLPEQEVGLVRVPAVWMVLPLMIKLPLKPLQLIGETELEMNVIVWVWQKYQQQQWD